MRWSVFTTSLSRSRYRTGAELELRRPPLSLVHPGKWHERNEQPMFLGDWMRRFPKSMRFFVRPTRWDDARRKTNRVRRVCGTRVKKRE